MKSRYTLFNYIKLYLITLYVYVSICSNSFPLLLLLFLFLGGAISTIVKDFRENHTDTTVLFTVTVVPGKRTAVFIFQHIILHTSHYFHLIPTLYNKLSPDIFTNIDLNMSKSLSVKVNWRRLVKRRAGCRRNLNWTDLLLPLI